jgi:predicted nucleotidyltransferase component of viral defense system
MIPKQDILDRAGEWQLRPEIVEKDYVLGWLLSGLGRNASVASGWIFKGGTCLKKCYFETYRFSEDLDFTLLPAATYTREGILEVLRTVARDVASESGITIPPETIVVDEKRDRQGRPTFKARLGYRGPLAYPGDPRRILFDLTAHEPVLRSAVETPIFHPYPDTLPPPGSIRAYELEELLAEKTRALLERTRPRDLYDVVYLINNRGTETDLVRTRELFLGKCAAKAITAPTAAALVGQIRGSADLRSDWEHMLRHQLPQLPPVDGMLGQLESILEWIDAPVPKPIPAAALPTAPMAIGEETVAPAGIRYWGRGVGLEAVRFAGANRLLVRFTYHARDRLVEPYSLRQARTGNILLYAWEVGSTHIKAFNTAEMLNIRPTETSFTPRYRVEFASGGFAPILPAAVPILHSSPFPSTSRPSRRTYRSGPTYVFACLVCGKEFRHSRNDSSLRRHKARGGWACSGRRGYLVRMS